jgi:putative Holliday junction resolvase
VTIGRFLGLDIGDRRIGVAVSDELGTIASPVGMIPRQSNVAAEVRALVAQYGAVRVIAGLPIGLSGREGPQAQAVRAFVDELARKLEVPVEFYDERLSTAVAERSLIAGGTRRAKRREKVDAVAAAVILQGYLDHQRWRRTR